MSNQQSGLSADIQEPWIGVHTLSEFAFCARAGICSHDNSGSDDGEEICDRPGFYHLPIFFVNELDVLREDLTWDRLKGVAIGFILFLAMVVAGFSAHSIFFAAALIIAIATLGGHFTFENRIRQVEAELQEWTNANSVIPRVDIAAPTVVHWPNVFVAGYDFEKLPEDILDDRTLHLRGRPWRYLRYGKLAIPVFLRNVTDGSAAKAMNSETPLIYDQHFVRIAAYCHLLELSTGLRVPYGVILTRGELTGVAIPNNQETRRRFMRALKEARRTMQELAEQPHVFPVMDERKCVRCPHGHPTVTQIKFSSRTTDKELRTGILDVHRASTKPKDDKEQGARQSYHSHCGDRFGWMPPHELTITMGLEED